MSRPNSRRRHRSAGQCGPAFVLLTLYVSLAGFALRMQGIEVLLQPLFGGFAGVNRAAQHF